MVLTFLASVPIFQKTLSVSFSILQISFWGGVSIVQLEKPQENRGAPPSWGASRARFCMKYSIELLTSQETQTNLWGTSHRT